MRSISSRTVLAAAAVAVVLSACGGGDNGPAGDPGPTALSASVTVTNASDSTLNGVYSTNTLALSDVTKFNPIGGEPETCRFRFSGLRQAGTTRLMDGDIRYIPGNPELRVTFVAINGIEFRLQGTTGAAVNRAANRIDYNGAVLTSTQGTAATIQLTGSIPMLGGRPEGC